jgi:hypothetical protein
MVNIVPIKMVLTWGWLIALGFTTFLNSSGASMIIIHDYPSKIPIELFSSSLNIIKPH